MAVRNELGQPTNSARHEPSPDGESSKPTAAAAENDGIEYALPNSEIQIADGLHQRQKHRAPSTVDFE